MSDISQKFDKTVRTERLSDDESVETHEAYEPHLDELNCLIQPLDDAFSEDLDGNFGKESLLFCEDADVLEGDRIIDESASKTYKVIGVKRMDFEDDIHMEIRIREFNG